MATGSRLTEAYDLQKIEGASCRLTPPVQYGDEKLRITFEFVGGPNDGKVLHGMLGEPSDAERYYLFTNHGAVGQRFKVASQYAVETLAEEQLKVDTPHHFQRHYYVVSDRQEDEDSVQVSAQYLPEAKESSSSS